MKKDFKARCFYEKYAFALSSNFWTFALSSLRSASFENSKKYSKSGKFKIYRIARMGQNFDDYSGFQQIPGMPILLQHISNFS